MQNHCPKMVYPAANQFQRRASMASSEMECSEPVHNPVKIPIYRGMRKTYPSDISREQFEHVRPDLDNLRRKTRPRTVDLYDVFCAVLYVLISGCQWRMLPGDFPKWRTVYYYWDQWSRRSRRGSSPLDRALKKSSHGRSPNQRPRAFDELCHPRFPERVEHRQRPAQRL